MSARFLAVEPDAKHPRMSPALVWGWLLFTLDLPLSWLWRRGAEARGMEVMMMSSRVHFVAITLVGMLLLVGIWTTAKARNSALLRQVAGLFLTLIVLETAQYGALVAELVPYDNLWLDYLPQVGVLLMMSAVASLILHAQREGARGAALFIPVLAQLGVLAGMVLFKFRLQLELIPWEAYNYIALAIGLFSCLSWLAIPREALSLDAAPSQEPFESESESESESSRPAPHQDILVGGAWAGGALLLILVIFSDVGLLGDGGLDGSSVPLFGLVAYGLFRVFRGAVRD